MTARAMLDPSMVLHPEAFPRLMGSLTDGNLDGLILPRSFIYYVDDADYIELLVTYFGLPDRPEATEGATTNARVVADMARQRVPVYDADIVKPMVEELAAIEDIDERIAELVLEEWQFLTTQSWLFSMVRSTLDSMARAGTATVQLSREKFEEAVRKELDKGEDESLSPNDSARSVAKWVARSGPPIMALFNPVVGTAAGLLSGIVLHYDP